MPGLTFCGELGLFPSTKDGTRFFGTTFDGDDEPGDTFEDRVRAQLEDYHWVDVNDGYLAAEDMNGEADEDGGDEEGGVDADPLAHLIAKEEDGEDVFAGDDHDDDRAFFQLLDMRGVPGDENLRVAHAFPVMEPIRLPRSSERGYKHEVTRKKESNARKPRKFNKRATIRRARVVAEYELLTVSAAGKVIDYYVEEKIHLNLRA